MKQHGTRSAKYATGCMGSVLALMCVQPLQAQDSAVSSVEEIVVTASRVQRTGFTAPTPTTVLDAGELEISNVTNIGQIMTQMPVFAPYVTPTTSTQSISGIGSNLLNLRDIGSTRTLVLIDGRRHVPTTTNAGVDVNVIPAALIDRVEVVTGGASAAWGSDAVAGVVNLILKKNFEGLSGSVQGGGTEHGDYRNYQASLLYGTAFANDRAHFSIATEYVDNDGILSAADRDWSKRQYGLVTNPNFAPDNGQYSLALAPNFQSSSATEGGLIVSGPLAGTDFGPGGVSSQLVTGDYFNGYGAGQSMSGGSGVSPGMYIPLAVPLTRSNVYTRLSFDFTDNLTGFVEASYAHSAGENPSSWITFDNAIAGAATISINNAFLPASIRSRMQSLGETSFRLGRFNTDFGALRSDETMQTMRGVAGLQGKFGEGWSWQAYYQYGKNEQDSKLHNNRIAANYGRAVNSILVGGEPVCAVNADAIATNDDPACVPINLFGTGAPSAAALDYISATSWRKVNLKQNAAAFDLQGTPFSTWAGPVSIATGAEYRKDEIDAAADPISLGADPMAPGGFYLGNSTPLSGGVEVTEGFVETVVPLLSNLPLVKSLEFNGAARLSHYSVAGLINVPSPHTESNSFDETTWKAGLSYQINDQFRLRATRSLDIRAPNVSELFTAQAVGTSTIIWSNLSTPVTTIRGGNPNLNPEEADTTTIGLVYQPAWLDGFQTSIDFYDIQIEGAIGTLAPQEIANRCAAGSASNCDLITFNDAGTPIGVSRQSINISEVTARGVDLEMSYVTPLSRFVAGWGGNLTLRLLTTYADELSTSDGKTKIDRAGETGYNSVNGRAHWIGNASATYGNGPLTVYLGGRYIGSGNYDNTYNLNGALDLENNRMASRFYVNTAAQYDLLGDGKNRLTLFANINNLLDKDPPVGPQNFSIPLQAGGYYEVIGRSFSIGMRFNY